MKNKTNIRRILFLVAVAALLLSVAAMAGAEVIDPCPEGVQHAGPFSYRNRVNATCTENGHWDKYCDACGRFVATEPIIAQGHQFEESIKIITLPTCLGSGLNQVSSICKVCN